MPRVPKGEKRPADVIGNAVLIARIATGEVQDTTERLKDAAAIAKGGLKGGKARAANLSQKKRSGIARKAARARWAKD